MKYTLINRFYYSGTTVFKNKARIRDKDKLDRFEHRCFQTRLRTMPPGNLSLDHLKSIHRHFFQDVYDWAGIIREVAMSKGESRFAQPEFIERELQKLINTIDISQLEKLDKKDFCSELTHIVSELNAIHPFMEGNGRTIRFYAQEICKKSGYNFKILGIAGEEWNSASKIAFYGDEKPLLNIIQEAVSSTDLKDKESTSLDEDPDDYPSMGM